MFRVKIGKMAGSDGANLCSQCLGARGKGVVSLKAA